MSFLKDILLLRWWWWWWHLLASGGLCRACHCLLLLLA
jgi:hypothetical protein